MQHMPKRTGTTDRARERKGAGNGASRRAEREREKSNSRAAAAHSRKMSSQLLLSAVRSAATERGLGVELRNPDSAQSDSNERSAEPPHWRGDRNRHTVRLQIGTVAAQRSSALRARLEEAQTARMHAAPLPLPSGVGAWPRNEWHSRSDVIRA